MAERHRKAASAAGTPALIDGLRSPLCYPHPVSRVEVIETHISWVMLAGDHAYKVKKPVRLPFADFSTLALRRHCCEEEVRLNRRTAPSLYRGVVAITGSAAAPVIGGEGEPLEYAVRMVRFPQADRLDERARLGRLTPTDIDGLAAAVSGFHAIVPPVRSEGGIAERELRLALDNLDALQRLDDGNLPSAALAALGDWTTSEHRAIAATLERRAAEGFVRECHGDLHLANVVLLGGAPTPFDGIEFNDALRCIDVMSDAAFLVMDLRQHGFAELSARFLDAYLARTGDYAGLAILRFHAVYRALVRAKVAAMRAAQARVDAAARQRAREDVDAHVRLAAALAARTPPSLTILHGLPGSGKTTVSQRLLEARGAIRLRSDLERKRLLGIGADDHSPEPPGEGVYQPAMRERVYVRLEAIAGEVLAAGYPVIVDAAFLERDRRDRFRALARAAGCAFHIVACEAPLDVLRQRVEQREAAGTDASDAGLAVLEALVAQREPLGPEELERATVVDTSREPAT